MPADLVTRLLLKNDEFDRSLKQSQKQIQSFDKMTASVSKGVTASFVSMAGGIGLAVGGLEAFNKTLMSSQTTGDAFVRVQEQAKASVDAFFSSLAMGDFSGFLQNIGNIVTKAGELADIMDELGTKTLFTNAEVRTLEQEYRIQKAIASDRSKSVEERKKAREEAENYIKQIAELQRSLAKTNTEAGYNTIRTELAKQGYKGYATDSQIDPFTKESNRSELVALGKEYGALYNEYKKWDNQRKSANTRDTHTLTSINDKYAEAEKKLRAMERSTEGGTAKLAYYFYELADEEDSALGRALQMVTAIGEINAAEAERISQLGTLDARLEKQADREEKTAAKAAEKVFSAGSFAAINQEIGKLKKVWEESTDEAIRIGAVKAIKDLEKRKLSIEIEYEMKSTALSAPGVTKPTGKNATNDIKSGRIKIEPIQPAAIQANFDYAEGLQSISSALGSVTNMVNNDAAGWLSWSANILAATAEAIPAIKALTNAQAAAAITGAAASASTIPVLGWINAIAAVAALTAAFANMPKFADGGIVGGSSFAGDRVPILANSGEMMLNDKQQRNLFNMLNNGTGANFGQMSYTVKVKGEDLYIALGNYNKRKSKIR